MRRTMVTILTVVFLLSDGEIVTSTQGNVESADQARRSDGESTEFNERRIAPEKTYSFADNLACTIRASTNPKEPGRQLSLIGLRGTNSKVLFVDTGDSFPLTKAFENERTITLLLVGLGTGSLDSFTLAKNTGLFVHVTSGNVASLYATAAKGNCK